MRNERQNALNRLREQQRRDNDFFFDKWETDFDKNFKRATKGIVAVWVAGIIGSLIFWGVVIWAIIELVQHFTS